MLGVLADGYVNAVLVKDRRRIDFAGTFGSRVFEFLAIGRIAVVFPDDFKHARVAFLDRFRIKRVAKPVSAAEEDFLAAIDGSQGWRTPLTVENARTDFGLIFAKQLAGFRIKRDEAGRV